MPESSLLFRKKKANDFLGPVQLSIVPETKVIEDLPLSITSDRSC